MLSTSVAVSVAICSPQPIVRAGLREILGRGEPIHVLDAPLPLQQTVAWIQEARPDIVLYEVTGTAETLAFLKAVKRCTSCSRTIILLGDFVEAFVISAFQEGAFGCLLKTASAEELVKALHAVHAGELWLSRNLFAKVLNHRSNESPALRFVGSQLTPRQRQVVQLVSCGMSNKDIAARLLITEATVRAHVNDIFKKLHFHHRVELAIHFAQNDHARMDTNTKFSN